MNLSNRLQETLENTRARLANQAEAMALIEQCMPQAVELLNRELKPIQELCADVGFSYKSGNLTLKLAKDDAINFEISSGLNGMFQATRVDWRKGKRGTTHCASLIDESKAPTQMATSILHQVEKDLLKLAAELALSHAQDGR